MPIKLFVLIEHTAYGFSSVCSVTSVVRTMRYEVEQKHRVDDVAALTARLAERGAVLGPPVVQTDRYFTHPARDFTRTDEALRIRTAAGASFVTYKGPKLDTATKTRQEIELPLDPRDADGARFGELLETLGFTPVATVRKSRRSFEFRRDGRGVAGALDDVEGLGTFVELEVVANEAGLDAAKRTIAELARELALGQSERRSYLELLLEK
jgi:adenylate cyclase, class 2